MNNGPLAQTQILHRAIRQVLLQDWDPIGIQYFSGPEDEYDIYVPAIYLMLITRKPVWDIFEYLLWVESERMGLAVNPQKTQQIAEKLVRLIEE